MIVTGFLLVEAADAAPRRTRGAALAISAVLHGTIVLSALGLARDKAAGAQRSADAAEPSVRLVYVAPAERRPPVTMVPPPAEAPRRPAAPPMDPVPEHEERAGSPAPAKPGAERQPVGTPEPAEQTELASAARDLATPAAAPASPAPAVLSTAELMRSEAQRIFGRRNRASGPRGGPAAATGLEVYAPPQPDECVPVPARSPGAAVELASVRGKVYREGTRSPLPGAHLQMIGTPYVTFSDADGSYELRFDPSLVDRCRTQYVRVTAPGFRAQMLVLYLGPAGSNEIPMYRR